MLGTFLIHFGDLIKLIPVTLRSSIFFDVSHCDLKVSRSQAKIVENFANYFFKAKANNK